MDGIQLRADWRIFEEDYVAIRQVLAELRKGANARSVLLVDGSGQIISCLDTPEDFDIVSFASLCAADFEANRQLARLIGESDFRTLYHQGVEESMYLSRVDAQVIVAVLFDRSTTLGLVRLRVKRAVEQLEALFQRLEHKAQAQVFEGELQVDDRYMEQAEAEIDNLFRD